MEVMDLLLQFLEHLLLMLVEEEDPHKASPLVLEDLVVGEMVQLVHQDLPQL
jgi:hypothetical protein